MATMDPMKAWREWFVKNEREWSESLTNLMQEESVAQSLGQGINAAIHRQQMFTQGLAGPMASMNVPSRADVMALGERIGQLEDAVARVEAALARIGSQGKAAPSRTRSAPPSAEASTGDEAPAAKTAEVTAKTPAKPVKATAKAASAKAPAKTPRKRAGNS